jgi:hypothetical protein
MNTWNPISRHVRFITSLTYRRLPFLIEDGIWSYHPHIIVAGRCVAHIVGAVTERTIKVVSQEPLLQAFSVKDMQAPQFTYLLRAVYLLQTNCAAHKLTAALVIKRA